MLRRHEIDIMSADALHAKYTGQLQFPADTAYYLILMFLTHFMT